MRVSGLVRTASTPDDGHVVAIGTDRLTKVFDDGTVAVDGVSLRATSGEFLVLLGPTGCGKSTILRLIAGLETATSGHVLIDDRVVDHLAARERRVAMVFQDYALYPHLTVAQNIGFPLRVRHEAGTDIALRVAEVAEQLGIADLLRRQPGVLSGGERQRVAMARAIVRRPHAFLLDEPLSNLDAGLRAELRSDVAALARRIGVTTVYVTHDQGEAMTMADRVAVLRRGVLQQVGTPREVYDDPGTLFVAAFLGTPRTNLLEGAVYADAGKVVVDLGSQVLELPADDPLRALHTERVTLALRADAMTPVRPGGAGGAARPGVARHGPRGRAPRARGAGPPRRRHAADLPGAFTDGAARRAPGRRRRDRARPDRGRSPPRRGTGDGRRPRPADVLRPGRRPHPALVRQLLEGGVQAGGVPVGDRALAAADRDLGAQFVGRLAAHQVAQVDARVAADRPGGDAVVDHPADGGERVARGRGRGRSGRWRRPRRHGRRGRRGHDRRGGRRGVPAGKQLHGGDPGDRRQHHRGRADEPPPGRPRGFQRGPQRAGHLVRGGAGKRVTVEAA